MAKVKATDEFTGEEVNDLITPDAVVDNFQWDDFEGKKTFVFNGKLYYLPDGLEMELFSFEAREFTKQGFGILK